MSKEMERLKDDINIKETTIQSIQSEFKQSTEVNVGKETNLYCIISQQSREIKHLQTELKTRSVNHTIVQTELRHALKELKQSKCELEYEREKAFTTKKQMNKMFQENKHFKIKISKNARKIQERHDSSKIAETLKNDTEAKMISIVDEANKHCVYLQEQLKQSCGVMASLSENCTKLRCSFQQKPIHISELKHGAERNAKTLHERESEMATTNHSFQRQLEDAGNELETSKQEIGLEENQSNIEMTRLRSEIKDNEATKLKKHLDDLRKTSNQKGNELRNNNFSLEQQLNIAETELRQEYNVTLKDAVKVKKETESNLKDIIIKQNEDINHLKAKIEMQNNQNFIIDEEENRSKQIQQALNVSHKKEAEFGRTIDILQRRDKENEGQIRELRDQLSKLSNASERKENKLQSMNTSLQTQLNTTETKLKELHQEKESLSSYIKREAGLNKENESLKEEVKLKEARINEYDIQCKNALKTKQEAECKLNEIINKQNYEIHYLQKQIEKKDIEVNDIAELKKHSEEVQRALNDLCEKEAELRKSNKDLHCRNREKEDEVRELKEQLSKMLKTASQKENESKQIIHSIEQQLKNTEANMRQQQSDISQEKKLMGTKDKDMVKMTEGIKSLKLQVKQKESTLQNCSEQYKDAIKLKQETELKLNEINHNHKTEIRHIQEDIERKDNEIARIDQINIRYEKVQSTLNESQEKEVTFREIIKERKIKHQENENRISELKRKLVKTLESHEIEYEFKETKHPLHQTIKSIETETDLYRQDIVNAKQLSKAAQMKMSEMDTRINDLTNKLKTKEEELQKGEENLSGIIDSQKEQIKHLEREVQKRERKMKSVRIETNNELQEKEKNKVELENQTKHMLSKLRDMEAELDETKSRLSRVRANNLSDNNPNITDLSDRNRPTKIAEKCAELYDNEWTDAFDVLEKLFRTEEAAIEALLLILQNAMRFCKTMSQRQIEFIEREMYFADEKEKITVSSDIQKLIKDRRKATATAVVVNLKKKYVAQLKQSKDKIMRAALDIEPYTSECIEICWFMLIQDPPIVFAPLPIKGSSFDTNFYKPYTKSGTYVDFAVWPALLMHERGPILAKGVAQGHGNK